MCGEIWDLLHCSEKSKCDWSSWEWLVVLVGLAVDAECVRQAFRVGNMPPFLYIVGLVSHTPASPSNCLDRHS